MIEESPEMWRHIFAGMRAEDTTSWHILWHLFAQSDNALSTAQLARRLHIPEPGVMRLMNKMGTDIAESTGWFPIPELENGWQVYFTRNLNTNGEWLYSIKKEYLPILATFRNTP